MAIAFALGHILNTAIGPGKFTLWSTILFIWIWISVLLTNFIVIMIFKILIDDQNSKESKGRRADILITTIFN